MVSLVLTTYFGFVHQSASMNLNINWTVCFFSFPYQLRKWLDINCFNLRWLKTESLVVVSSMETVQIFPYRWWKVSFDHRIFTTKITWKSVLSVAAEELFAKYKFRNASIKWWGKISRQLCEKMQWIPKNFSASMKITFEIYQKHRWTKINCSVQAMNFKKTKLFYFFMEFQPFWKVLATSIVNFLIIDAGEFNFLFDENSIIFIIRVYR